MENYRILTDEQLNQRYNDLKESLGTHRRSEERTKEMIRLMTHMAFEMSQRDMDIQKEIDQAWDEHDNV